MDNIMPGQQSWQWPLLAIVKEVEIIMDTDCQSIPQTPVSTAAR